MKLFQNKHGKKTLFGRIALITVAVMLLLTVLVGCASTTTVEEKSIELGTVKSDQKETRTSEVDASKFTAEADLSVEEMTAVAEMLGSAYENGFNDVKLKLVGVTIEEDQKQALTDLLTTANQSATDKKIEDISAITDKLTAEKISTDITQLSNSLTFNSTVEGANGLDQTALTALAKIIKESFNASDYDSHERLVAAYRGYDMTDEDLEVDETDEERDNLNKNGGAEADVVAAAKAVFEEAYKKDTASVSKDDFNAYLAKLNKADVLSLVNAFRVSVSVEKESGVLRGIGVALDFITTYLGFGNYVVGICIFAILIEIVLLPLAIKQQKNSQAQAKLRPKEMAIRNKYKGRTDQPTMQKMQAEIQELYQKENYSPYSGCLPLIIQLPIIIVLYNIVIDPIRYVLGFVSGVTNSLATYATAAKAAGGLGLTLGSRNVSIELLSHMDDGFVNGLKNFTYFSNSGELSEALEGIHLPNFDIGSLNFGLTPSFDKFSVLLLIPVLTFVTYFFTARLTRKFSFQPATNAGMSDKQQACSNNMMDITMPLMSSFFTLMVPAVIGIYWIFRSWLGLLKTYIISRVMPLPKFTEEDVKAAAKELAGKKTVTKSANAGAVRSLHHIDDEDFEDTREQALARKAAIEEREKREREEAESKKGSGLFSLKETRKKKEDQPRDGEEKQSDDAGKDNSDPSDGNK